MPTPSLQVDDMPTGDVPLDPSAMVTGFRRDNVDQTRTGSTRQNPGFAAV